MKINASFLSNKEKGFSLVEVLLTSTLLGLILSSFTGAYIYGNTTTAIAGSREQAVLLAEEGIEAIRNIRDEDFANLTPGTYGFALSGNEWILSGTSDNVGIFTRNVTISSINEYEKQATVNVAWQQNYQRTGLVTLVTNLTDWRREVLAEDPVLDIDITNASLGASGTEIQGITVENLGDENIYIDKITATWSSNNQIEWVRILGYTIWSYYGYGSPSGRQDSGTELDPWDFVIYPGEGALPVNEIKFSGDMTGDQVNLVFTLTTGQSYEVDLDFYVAPPPAWTLPTQVGIYNTDYSASGKDVQVYGDTAYLLTSSSGPDFYKLDVSNHASPVVSRSLSLSDNAERFDMFGGKAYVASSSNSAELQVFDVGSFSIMGDYDKQSSSNAMDIVVSGNNAYLVTRSTGGNPGYELYSIDISNPSSPVLQDGINIGAGVTGIDINGNYLYLATDNNSSEIWIVDASDPSNLSTVSTINLTGNTDANTVLIEGNILYVGREKISRSGEFYIIDVSDPLSPVFLNGNGYEINDIVNDIFIYDNKAFLATENTSAEFQVLNITDKSSPTLIGYKNLSSDATAVVVSDGAAFVTTENRYQELVIIEPY